MLIEKLVNELRRCKRSHDALQVKHVLGSIHAHQLESHPCLANYLVPTLVQCGCLSDAHHIFNKLPLFERNHHSWNSIIYGYVECGMPGTAFLLYQQMPDSVQPDTVTFLAVLAACSSLKDGDRGLSIHADITTRGMEIALFNGRPVLGNKLVYMYGKCDRIVESQQVFNVLGSRDVVSWNALMACYIECGLGEQVSPFLGQMLRDGISPDSVTVICSLKVCTNYESVKVLHIETTKRGFESDIRIGSTLVDVYAAFGLLVEASFMVHYLPLQDCITWNALIAGYADGGFAEEVQKCLRQMVSMGIAPDTGTFLCSSRGFATAKSVDLGKELHSEAVKRGLEGQLQVGTTLIDMYIKCLSFVEACKVLDTLSVRNVASWNALIAGYAAHGMCAEAITCFRSMLKEGIHPDLVTFACSLKAVGKTQDVELGLQLHTEVTKRGFEDDYSISSTLVDMYIRQGVLEVAQGVFSRLLSQNAVSLNALVLGFTEYGLFDGARNWFHHMLLENSCVDHISLNCSLKACGAVGDIENAKKLHAETVKKGLDGELHFGSALVGMYNDCGSLQEAQQVFYALPFRNTITWNALITGYSEGERHEEVLNCIHQMSSNGVPTDSITYTFGLKACTSLRSLDMGQCIYIEVIKRGLERESKVGNLLVCMFTACRSLTEAGAVYDMMPGLDDFSWNDLIAGYAAQGFAEQAEGLLKRMLVEGLTVMTVGCAYSLKAFAPMKALELGQELYMEACKRGLDNDSKVAVALIDMYIDCGIFLDAQRVFEMLPSRNRILWSTCVRGSGNQVATCFQQLLLDGTHLDSVVFVCSLKACAAVRALETGKEVHSEAVKRGWEQELRVGSMLVDMYTECGLHKEALKVLFGLSVRDMVVWNALIAGYIEHGFSEEARSSFQLMLLDGVSPDQVSFICGLQAFGSEIESGQELHSEVLKRGFELDSSICSTLLDMYGNSGLLPEARQVFDMLPTRTVELWTTMVKIYGKNHEASMAIRCFEDMLAQGTKPSSVTLACLLAACSHGGLIDQGQEYFELMKKQGIELTLDHYICMVDLFARSGRLDDAERLIAAMQCSPCPLILCTLLNSSKIFCNVKLGEECFRLLLEASQEDSAVYLLMADIYASVGRWEDANTLDEMRKVVGSKKKAGSALLMVNSKAHEFTVGAKQNRDILETGLFLSTRWKGDAYVPNLDFLSKHVFNV